MHPPHFQGRHAHIVGKEPNGFSGPCAAWYRMVASSAGCHPSTPEGGIGSLAGPRAQGTTPSNKPRPGDADAPVINGLLLGLVTVITPCVLSENADFHMFSWFYYSNSQAYYSNKDVITAITGLK